MPRPCGLDGGRWAGGGRRRTRFAGRSEAEDGKGTGFLSSREEPPVEAAGKKPGTCRCGVRTRRQPYPARHAHQRGRWAALWRQGQRAKPGFGVLTGSARIAVWVACSERARRAFAGMAPVALCPATPVQRTGCPVMLGDPIQVGRWPRSRLFRTSLLHPCHQAPGIGEFARPDRREGAWVHDHSSPCRRYLTGRGYSGARGNTGGDASLGSTLACRTRKAAAPAASSASSQAGKRGGPATRVFARRPAPPDGVARALFGLRPPRSERP